MTPDTLADAHRPALTAARLRAVLPVHLRGDTGAAAVPEALAQGAWRSAGRGFAGMRSARR